MLRIGFPVIGVTDVPRATEFWTAALDLVATGEWRSPRWQNLDHKDGSGRALALMYSESAAEQRPRLHLDLFVDTTEEQQAEVDRLVTLGAGRVLWELYPADPTSSYSRTRTAISSASWT